VIILTARASERLVPATARDHRRPARLPAIHAPGAFLPATDGHADGGIIFADEHARACAEMLLPAVKGRIAARYRMPLAEVALFNPTALLAQLELEGE